MMICNYVASFLDHSWSKSISQFQDRDSICVTSKYQIPKEELDNKLVINDSQYRLKYSTKLHSILPKSGNEVCENEALSRPQLREPLQFHFTGYSIWLELEEESFDFDLSRSISKVSQELDLLPIPCPHVTAIYGMTHISPEDVVKKWNLEVKSSIKSWPELLPSGLIVDIEKADIDGGTMDMAWAEISYKNSVEHELKLDALHDIFFENTENETKKMRPPWKPHLSLAYDNPDNSILSLHYINSLICKEPTLTKTRKVKNISLWSTWGRMTEWKLLDRCTLDDHKPNYKNS